MRRALATALAALGLTTLAATPAHAATFEQVGCFAGSFPGLTDSCKPVEEQKFGEEVQLGGIGGMAVNYTGAGGVPAGTVYAATQVGGAFRIAMFTPKPDGGLQFELAWQVRNDAGAYGRCGPALEVKCEPRVAAGAGVMDVEVDQTTGNVYALNGEILAGQKMVVEYDAEGTEEITRFGEKAASGKTTAETPTQIHGSRQGGLAINGAGEVYVFDKNNPDGEYHRLMVFEPKTPGVYSEYEYAGDVAAGFNADGRTPARPVIDAAGNVYVAGEEGYVEEYAPEAPAPYPAPPAQPVCEFEFAKGGITAMTVNPLTGEPFFFTLKKEAKEPGQPAVKLVHQLSACDEETGEFTETGKFTLKPERDDLYGMAYDPTRQLEGRPAGVLYGGAPGPVPDVGKGEPGQSSLGYVFAPPKLQESPPEVESQSVAHVTQTTALLRAQVNPRGFPTSYRFQYLTRSEYTEAGESFTGAEEAPPGGALLGEAKVALSAAAPIGGLSSDTEYLFRAVAESECAPAEPGKACTVPGPAGAFRTYPPEAPGLPDHRAWELVSPPQKHGGQVFPADGQIDSCGIIGCKPGHYGHQPFPQQSTPDGEAVAYEGTSFGPGEGATLENQYIARRSESGWQSTNPTPQLLQPGSGYRAFDASLSRGVLVQHFPTPLSPEAPSGTPNLYTQPSAEPLALTPLLSAAPPNREGGAFEIDYAGASADLSRVFFRANDALTGTTPFAPEPAPEEDHLYEWHAGQLRLVDVLPGNAAVSTGASFAFAGANAISDDGSRAFFKDESGQTYVREDGEATRAIPGGEFLIANPEGSRVLLDDGSLYDLETEETTDLTEGQGGFEGIAGQSEDLSRVYFVDTAVLSEAENGEGAKAQAGEFNLYAWEEGSPTRFVATLQPGDNKNQTSGGGVVGWAKGPAGRTAEASPDGRYLAFVSRALLSAPLPGYSKVGPCEEISGTGEFHQVPCPQVFLYDSASGELTCASCAPSGAAPLGWSVLRRLEGAPGSMPQSRYLSDEGRLFFDSQDSLVPADTNEGIEDVYEYEPNGVGTCEREEGCISLISAGTGTVDSNFLAADETGANVFFTTRDQLVLKDKDELIDLYDARELGGIPAETETQSGECQGEACQPPVFAPDDPTPGSASFLGAGNVQGKAPSGRKPCAKGKVKRRGRCVPKKRQHHKRSAHRNGRKSR